MEIANRLIKFRVWDNVKNEMKYDVGLFPFDGTDVYRQYNGKNIIDYLMVGTNNKRFTLMQFTGLNDQNNKKIYENDILHWNFMVMYSSKKGEIREDSYAQVIWGHTGFTVTKIKGHLRSLFFESAVVIGNIYENPELLKEG